MKTYRLFRRTNSAKWKHPGALVLVTYACVDDSEAKPIFYIFAESMSSRPIDENNTFMRDTLANLTEITEKDVTPEDLFGATEQFLKWYRLFVEQEKP